MTSVHHEDHPLQYLQYTDLKLIYGDNIRISMGSLL